MVKLLGLALPSVKSFTLHDICITSLFKFFWPYDTAHYTFDEVSNRTEENRKIDENVRYVST